MTDRAARRPAKRPVKRAAKGAAKRPAKRTAKRSADRTTSDAVKRSREKVPPRAAPAVPPPAHLEGEREEDHVGGIAAFRPAPPIADIRDLGETEREALAALLTFYGDGLQERWEAGHLLKVVARSDLEPQRRVVLVPPDVLGVLAPFEPQVLGVPVAGLSRRGARLTLEGAVLIAPYATRRVVRLKPKGETMFLYGRHILIRSIARVVGPMASGDEVLVVRDEDGACLGVGVAQPPLLRLLRPGRRELDGDDVAMTNRTDLGLYLRAPQEAPE